ncbi:ABC transporter ATP-binding protein [Nocardioides sp. YIM 152315]|uniref:ABC transporter ATP-binding protein n=1 Tax=Nocardioides sp. YIM 152315 TaxID=3031760 RepID=UPI0023DA03A7|nr:ABC transporter ATP-binding protein [Nocardioides sp. YIM 152315]MDF1603442.1 ABC transporter ATP-binding protein [Nocardioides sp. YIM 152315]
MAADVAPTDPLALRAAARSAPKSFGRLSQLVGASVSLVWSAARLLFLALVALQLLAAVALAAQVLAVRELLDAVLTADSQGDTGIVLTPIVMLAALTAVAAVTTALQGQLQRLLGECVTRTMWSKVLSVATGVGLRFFESPEFFNRLNRVQTSALVRPYQVTQGLLTMAGALAASLGLGLVLLRVAPVLLPLVVIGGIPMLITSRRESRLEFDFAVEQTPTVRLRSYLAMLQTGRPEAKEVRAFGLGRWLGNRFDGLYATYLHDLKRHVRRRSILSLVGQVGSAVVLGGTLIVLAGLIARGRIDVATAGAAVVAIRLLATQVQTLFRGVQTIFESGLFLDDLDEFLAYGRPAGEEDSGAEAPESFDALRAEGLTFRYPGSETPALRGVDIDLRAGEVVALVGENGSGKTTLAKLLAGLYEPEAGRILWDDRDAAAFRPSSLRSRISVVFQDFVRYALPATENIAVGRVDEPADPLRVRMAAAAAGADATLDSLPHGYDTVLSRMFADGTDLSGGQWQRVALARSFYRDAPLVILDEPSAALDPRAEHELFSTLREALHGRTALFISHRFSTVRGADRIYVLHEGEVVEQGSHDDLIAQDGRYAELYRLQSDAYVAKEMQRR